MNLRSSPHRAPQLPLHFEHEQWLHATLRLENRTRAVERRTRFGTPPQRIQALANAEMRFGGADIGRAELRRAVAPRFLQQRQGLVVLPEKNERSSESDRRAYAEWIGVSVLDAQMRERLTKHIRCFTHASAFSYPAATSFTFAFDCGSGYSTSSSTISATCPTTHAGTVTVRGKVIDQDDDKREYSAIVTVLTVPEATTGLRLAVENSTLSPDIRKAFFAKLDAALRAIDKGATATACSALQDFINQLNAQRGKAIPIAIADAWLITAQQLRTGLGC